MKRKGLTEQEVRRIALETSVGFGSMGPNDAVVNSLLRVVGCKK